MNDPLLSHARGNRLLSNLWRFALVALLLFVVMAYGVVMKRNRQDTGQSQPLQVAQGSDASHDLIAPVLEELSVTIHSATPDWQAMWTADDIPFATALSARYPDLNKRFPDGVSLTVLDETYAPEVLRGPYDPTPTRLLAGAISPQPQPGESILPDAEAWAGCRRDLELGPARQLHCYLSIRGKPGDTLDGLAVVAWVQALDIAVTGTSQPLEPDSLPFVTISQENNQWIYAESSLSLKPSALPVSSSSP